MTSGKQTASWVRRVQGAQGPVYAAIVRGLEEAIREGELHPGDRLPAQRELAAQLGVDFTTVTRAYAAARARGLLEGTVGRGTFVRARTEDDEAGLVDLSMNLPPPPEGLSLGAMLKETAGAILQRTDPAVLMAYHPGAGTVGQRAAGVQWLAPSLGEVQPDRLLVAPGAQAALAALLTTLCRPGDTLVAEPLTYPGFRNIAALLGLRVVACETDAEGPRPDALADLCARETPAAVYLVPTMQNPTATTMGLERRRQVSKVAADAGAWIIEDDPYSRLADDPLPALATFAPQRTFHVATLAKCLSPGLRIAYVACPDAAASERVALSLRATALMPAPLMAAVATTWIREGAAETLLKAVRAETRARRALAAEALPTATGSPDSIHVWLPLPAGVAPEQVRAAAQERGLALVTAEAFAVGPLKHSGVRISLGGPGRRAVLASALARLQGLLATGAPDRLVV